MVYDDAQKILQETAQHVQQIAHRQIASIVTKCLQVVFDDLYSFHIHFEQKRGKTEARMVFRREFKEFDPATECGGGILNVAAFGLRLAALVLCQPAKRKLLILDEPFRDVNGEEFQSRFKELLLTLAQEMGIQFIIASDDDWLRIGKVIQL